MSNPHHSRLEFESESYTSSDELPGIPQDSISIRRPSFLGGAFPITGQRSKFLYLDPEYAEGFEKSSTLRRKKNTNTINTTSESSVDEFEEPPELPDEDPDEFDYDDDDDDSYDMVSPQVSTILPPPPLDDLPATPSTPSTTSSTPYAGSCHSSPIAQKVYTYDNIIDKYQDGSTIKNNVNNNNNNIRRSNSNDGIVAPPISVPVTSPLPIAPLTTLGEDSDEEGIPPAPRRGLVSPANINNVLFPTSLRPQSNVSTPSRASTPTPIPTPVSSTSSSMNISPKNQILTPYHRNVSQTTSHPRQPTNISNERGSNVLSPSIFFPTADDSTQTTTRMETDRVSPKSNSKLESSSSNSISSAHTPASIIGAAPTAPQSTVVQNTDHDRSSRMKLSIKIDDQSLSDADYATVRSIRNNYAADRYVAAGKYNARDNFTQNTSSISDNNASYTSTTSSSTSAYVKFSQKDTISPKRASAPKQTLQLSGPTYRNTIRDSMRDSARDSNRDSNRDSMRDISTSTSRNSNNAYPKSLTPTSIEHQKYATQYTYDTDESEEDTISRPNKPRHPSQLPKRNQLIPKKDSSVMTSRASTDIKSESHPSLSTAISYDEYSASVDTSISLSGPTRKMSEFSTTFTSVEFEAPSEILGDIVESNIVINTSECDKSKPIYSKYVVDVEGGSGDADIDEDIEEKNQCSYQLSTSSSGEIPSPPPRQELIALKQSIASMAITPVDNPSEGGDAHDDSWNLPPDIISNTISGQGFRVTNNSVIDNSLSNQSDDIIILSTQEMMETAKHNRRSLGDQDDKHSKTEVIAAAPATTTTALKSMSISTSVPTSTLVSTSTSTSVSISTPTSTLTPTPTLTPTSTPISTTKTMTSMTTTPAVNAVVSTAVSNFNSVTQSKPSISPFASVRGIGAQPTKSYARRLSLYTTTSEAHISMLDRRRDEIIYAAIAKAQYNERLANSTSSSTQPSDAEDSADELSKNNKNKGHTKNKGSISTISLAVPSSNKGYVEIPPSAFRWTSNLERQAKRSRRVQVVRFALPPAPSGQNRKRDRDGVSIEHLDIFSIPKISKDPVPVQIPIPSNFLARSTDGNVLSNPVSTPTINMIDHSFLAGKNSITLDATTQSLMSPDVNAFLQSNSILANGKLPSVITTNTNGSQVLSTAVYQPGSIIPDNENFEHEVARSRQTFARSIVPPHGHYTGKRVNIPACRSRSNIAHMTESGSVPYGLLSNEIRQNNVQNARRKSLTSENNNNNGNNSTNGSATLNNNSSGSSSRQKDPPMTPSSSTGIPLTLPLPYSTTGSVKISHITDISAITEQIRTELQLEAKQKKKDKAANGQDVVLEVEMPSAIGRNHVRRMSSFRKPDKENPQGVAVSMLEDINAYDHDQYTALVNSANTPASPTNTNSLNSSTLFSSKTSVNTPDATKVFSNVIRPNILNLYPVDIVKEVALELNGISSFENYCLSKLQQGTYVYKLKAGKLTRRYLFVGEDMNSLCWRALNAREEKCMKSIELQLISPAKIRSSMPNPSRSLFTNVKSISLSDVYSIYYGPYFGKEFKSYALKCESSEAKSWLALSIETKDETLNLIFTTVQDATNWAIGLQVLSPANYRSFSLGKMLWMRVIMKVNHIGFSNFVQYNYHDWSADLNKPGLIDL